MFTFTFVNTGVYLQIAYSQYFENLTTDKIASPIHIKKGIWR
jgi:hypothetical protein